MNERITKNFILQVPINENDIEKPIVFDENRTIFMFPGVEGKLIYCYFEKQKKKRENG